MVIPSLIQHKRDGGALTPEASIARLNRREAELEVAIIAESDLVAAMPRLVSAAMSS